MTTIRSITETSIAVDAKYQNYDGYKVETDEGVFFIVIENDSQCCENWGYLSSNDELHEFEGSELYSVNIVDTKLETVEDVCSYEGDCMFVNLETSGGTLQLVCYNEHNGYYGHHAMLLAGEKEIHSEYL